MPGIKTVIYSFLSCICGINYEMQCRPVFQSRDFGIWLCEFQFCLRCILCSVGLVRHIWSICAHLIKCAARLANAHLIKALSMTNPNTNPNSYPNHNPNQRAGVKLASF